MKYKLCKKCSTTKPISDFWRNRSAKDGYQHWCKGCCKENYAARMARDPEYQRKIMRESARRRAAVHPKRVYSRKPYDEKEKARRRIQDRVARGVVQRQPCERCSASKAQAHHDDYSKPLEVRWLCPLCHAAVHRELR